MPCPHCRTEAVTIGERTFQAARPCPEHRLPTPIRSLVAGKGIRSTEDALEEFFRFHRAHNGGRRTDPVDFITVESVERDAAGGFTILYQVPPRMRTTSR
jgi:hypothetical protein